MGLIAVGDIHGCSRTLKALLKALSPGVEDHLVFLGDYVDRGPDTRGVIHQLIALSKQVRCTFLRGNHEQAMLDWLNGKRGTYWLGTYNRNCNSYGGTVSVVVNTCVCSVRGYAPSVWDGGQCNNRKGSERDQRSRTEAPYHVLNGHGAYVRPDLQTVRS